MINLRSILESDPRSPSSCLVIGEVAQAHDGSLGSAHAFIDAIASAGAGAVKFQTHIAAAESTPGEPWRVKFSRQDASRYDYWRRMEFTETQWSGLRAHAHDRGLMFLSSPFSLEAVELLTRVGVPGWKVASGELSSLRMFDAMAATRLPFLVSTGMSPMAEVDAIVARLKARNLPLALMQCTTAYPCPAERVGLNVMEVFRQRHGCHVGLSDHSGTIYPGLAAAAMGCSVLEVHVTLSKEAFGPDVPASLTPGELRQLVEGVRFIERMRANPVDKDAEASGLQPLRRLFTKSIVARRSLPAGTILTEQDLTLKKPGTGLPEDRMPEVLGKSLRVPVAADEVILEEALE